MTSEDLSQRRVRLERLAFQRLGYVGASSAEQIKAIVDRALADPPPVSHPHSPEETGMCNECDAAWVLAMEEMSGEAQIPPAKVRNAVVILRSRFAMPESWDPEAWETHLEEVAKLILLLGRIGKRP